MTTVGGARVRKVNEARLKDYGASTNAGTQDEPSMTFLS
jgi:hypothetical protein